MPPRLTILVLLGLLVGCATPPPDESRYVYAQMIMGVEGRITLYSDDEAVAREAARRAFARIVELDAVLSDWRADSELSELGRRAGTGPIPVSVDLLEILVQAKSMSRASGGAFDVTIGPVVLLWREARATGTRPSESTLREARARCGADRLRLDLEARTATLAVTGMRLDLGGIGKGFAADAAVAVLRDAGTPRCLVDLGGDLVAGAAPPGRRDWRIAVASGLGADDAGTLPLVDAAVATSGDLEQFAVIDGVRYGHIIDPRTGAPLQDRYAVTVIASDGTTADALASAVSVLGADAGLALVATFPGAAARIRWRVGERDDAPIRERTAGDFPELAREATE